MIAAFLLVYGQTLVALARDWWTNEDYAHGLFTPFALAYLIYERRKELTNIPLAPSSLGFLVILASQAVLTVGFLGAEFFLQRVSMLLLFAGAILFFWGWQALFKTSFGLVLLLLAIPLPVIIFNAIAIPLQLLASGLAELLLGVLNVPIYREGNILQLPHDIVLNVVEACSGIRSLVSLTALATLTTMLSRFRPIPWWGRMSCILSAVPVALATNALRVTGTAVLAHAFGERYAEGFFHSFSSMLVFVFGFVAILLEMLLLERLTDPERKAAL